MTRQITVYKMPWCSQCMMTTRWLDRAGVEYRTVDVSESEFVAAAIRSLGYKTAPVVIVSNGDAETDIHWGGFDPDALAKYAGAIA